MNHQSPTLAYLVYKLSLAIELLRRGTISQGAEVLEDLRDELTDEAIARGDLVRMPPPPPKSAA